MKHNVSIMDIIETLILNVDIIVVKIKASYIYYIYIYIYIYIHVFIHRRTSIIDIFIHNEAKYSDTNIKVLANITYDLRLCTNIRILFNILYYIRLYNN